MVAALGDRIHVQTLSVSLHGLLTVAKYAPQERLTDSLRCPLIYRNSQVIRRFWVARRGGGLLVACATRDYHATCWAVAPQPMADSDPLTASFAVRSVNLARNGLGVQSNAHGDTSGGGPPGWTGEGRVRSAPR